MKELEQLQKEHQELGKRIQELKDSLNKPKGFEVGRWYKSPRGALMCIVDYIDDIPSGYGFFTDGSWGSEFLFIEDNWISIPPIPATEQEVKDALIKEAESRGYRKDVIINSLGGNIGWTIKNPPRWEYFPKKNMLRYDDDAVVFKKGQWATIIKDETIKIEPYEVKFSNDKVFIDGYSYDRRDLYNIKIALAVSNVKSLNVGCSGQYQVTLETIDKILDRLK